MIDGGLYRMAASNRMQQELVMELTYLIKDYIRNKNDGYKAGKKTANQESPLA